MPFFKRILVGGITISALSVGLSIPALAQTESATAPQPVAEDEGDAIVVTGIRASQRASIDLKRENIAVVDSIVAEDMGKLPDQNVAESLQRSEEHTSELQSLMRISYAVFCLKKKKKNNHTHL